MYRIATATIATLASCAAAAAEQSPPVTSANGDSTAHIQEVTVTAQRREQNLQEVPVAVTALTSDDVERLQISDTSDLIYQVPNLIGNNNVGLGSSNTYYIRGVGNTESIATTDVPVGTYVDDVYIGRQNANNFGLFDVERIEVLRGPQGTLFGRNTTGGAINVILKKPSTEFGGYLEGATGSFDALDYRGSLDVPVSDRVLTKVSFFRRKNDGYARQISTGDMLNDLDSLGARAALRLLPTDTLTVDVTADLIDDENSNLLNRVDANGNRIVITGITKDALARFFTGDKRFIEPGNEARTASGSANVQWELPAVTLSSITGYRRTHQFYFIDSNTSPPNPIPTGVSPLLNDSIHEQWSQEFRANGKTLGDAIDYVVGVYYLHEDNETDLGTGVATATTFTVSGDRTIENTLSTYAAYAQADYHFASNLTATLGLRFTDESKDLDVFRNPGALGPNYDSTLIAAAGIPLNLDETFLTPRAALSYQYSPDVMFFVSATRGAKSGGWSGRSTTNTRFTPFEPEKVWSEEIGVRSSLFDDRLRLNATAFYAYTTDVQISARFVNPVGETYFTTSNPADLRNYGGEIEAAWLPLSGLTLTAAVGLQHARYTNVSAAVQSQMALCQQALATNNVTLRTNNCSQGFVDFAGRIATPVRAPDMTFIGSATYQFVTPIVTLKPSANFMLNDGYAIGNFGSPDSIDGSWTKDQFLWNASVLAQPAALPNLSVAVGCENCSDQAYDVSFLSSTSIYLNAPRTWSARLRYAF